MAWRPCRLLSCATAILLILQAAYFFWFAYAVGSLFFDLSGISGLPNGIWLHVAAGAILGLCGVAILRSIQVGRWFPPLATAMLVYGIWGIWRGFSIIASFSMTDIPSLELASAFCFVAASVLGMASLMCSGSDAPGGGRFGRERSG
jgi:hypothetical protein